MMKHYWAPRTRSLRALWVLEEAGVPFERVRLDLSAGEHKSADYCAINPMAKVFPEIDRSADDLRRRCSLVNDSVFCPGGRGPMVDRARFVC